MMFVYKEKERNLMKKRRMFILCSIITMLILSPTGVYATGQHTIADVFPDVNLAKAIAEQLHNNQNTSVQITDEQLGSIKNLTIPRKNIRDLSGVEKLKNLEFISANDNAISDISMLSKLPNLKGVIISEQVISLPNIKATVPTEFILRNEIGVTPNYTLSAAGTYDNKNLTWNAAGESKLTWLSSTSTVLFSGTVIQNVLSFTYLDVELRGGEPTIYLNLNNQEFMDRKRFMVFVDGKYHFETYHGKFYSSLRETTQTGFRVRRAFAGTKGQKVELYLAPNWPGASTNGKVLLEEYTVEEDMIVNTDVNTDGFVKDIWYTGGNIFLTIDRAAYEARNRITIRLDGRYIGETFNNKHYYTYTVSNTNDTITIARKIDIQPGGVVSVVLLEGIPGNQNSREIAPITTWVHK